MLVEVVVQHIKGDSQRVALLEEVLRPGGLAELGVLNQSVLVVIQRVKQLRSFFRRHLGSRTLWP